MKKILKAIFKFFGYRVSQLQSEDLFPFKNYDYGDEAVAIIEQTGKYSMMPHVNLVTLYEQAVYCEKNGIEGAFVECGVWKGGAVGMMAKANLNYGSERRKLHLFDAFDNICEPDPKIDGAKAMADVKFLANVDAKDLSGKIEPIPGAYDYLGGHGTIAICDELLIGKIGYPSDYLFYHKGFFEKTMENDSKSVGPIAILRLDGDWYSSTKVSLNCLYDKVVKGGIVIIDDYGYYEGCAKAVDEFLKARNIVTFLSYTNYCCRYFIKP